MAYGATSIGSLPRGALGLAITQVVTLPRKTRVRVAEAFQMVAVRQAPPLQRGVIVVVGARLEDGKSTLTAHIAAELAAAGNDVIAVEADLHVRRAAPALGVEPEQPGMGEVGESGGALTTSLIEIENEVPEEPTVRSRRPAVLAGRRGNGRSRRSGSGGAEPADGDLGNGPPSPASRVPGRRSAVPLPAGVTRGQATRSHWQRLFAGAAPARDGRLRGDRHAAAAALRRRLSADSAGRCGRHRVPSRCHPPSRSAPRTRRPAVAGVSDFSVVFTESDVGERDYYGYESSFLTRLRRAPASSTTAPAADEARTGPDTARA